MKEHSGNLGKILPSLLPALLMASVGIAVAGLAAHARQADAQQLAVLQMQRSELARRLAQTELAAEERARDMLVFQKLQARGITDEAQGFGWIDLLKEIGRERRLPDLHIEFSPQQALLPDSNDPLIYMISTMKLQLTGLHEEDLERVLDDLERKAPALIQTRSCHLARTSSSAVISASPRAAEGVLEAHCELAWVSLRERAGRS